MKETTATHAAIHQLSYYTRGIPQLEDKLCITDTFPVVYVEHEELADSFYETVNALYVSDTDTYLSDPVALVNLEYIAQDDDLYDQSTTVVRSNFRSLQRDFDTAPWVVEQFSHTEVLMIPCGYLSTEDGQALWDTLVNMAEKYPLYDEMDHSNLEMEEIEAAWTLFGKDDLSSELLTAFQEEFNTENLWDPIVSWINSNVETIPDNGGNPLYEHDGHDVTFDYEGMVSYLSERLWKFLFDVALNENSAYHRGQLTLV